MTRFCGLADNNLFADGRLLSVDLLLVAFPFCIAAHTLSVLSRSMERSIHRSTHGYSLRVGLDCTPLVSSLASPAASLRGGSVILTKHLPARSGLAPVPNDAAHAHAFRQKPSRVPQSQGTPLFGRACLLVSFVGWHRMKRLSIDTSVLPTKHGHVDQPCRLR